MADRALGLGASDVTRPLTSRFEHPKANGTHDSRDVFGERQSIEDYALSTRGKQLHADHGSVGGVVDAPAVIESNLVMPLSFAETEVRGVTRLVVLEEWCGHGRSPRRQTVITRSLSMSTTTSTPWVPNQRDRTSRSSS